MLSFEKILASSILFSVLLGGCSSSSGGSSAPLGTVPVTPATGGTLTITSGPLAGLVLVVPANSVAADTNITVHLGTPTVIAGRTAIGSVATFGPVGTTFNPAATLTLPFTPLPGPVIEIDEDLMIAMRDDATGEVVEVEADSVDEESGTATLDLDHFSSFWVTTLAPIPPPVLDVVLSDFLPLNIGDHYEFVEEAGGAAEPVTLTLDVEAMTTNPNVPGATIRLVARFDGEVGGEYYSRAANGDLITHGIFDASPDEGYEEVYATPLVFAPGMITLPSSLNNETDFTGHEPVGSPTVQWTGHTMFATIFEADDNPGSLPGEVVVTPAGVFENVFFIDRFEAYTSSMENGTERIVWGLAEGVGYIGFEISEDGGGSRLFLLTSAVVGGVTIGLSENR